MDRSFEDLRHEVLELDTESKRRLADAIEHDLAESEDGVSRAWDEEIARRIDTIDSGEATFVSEEEFFARGRGIIEEAKRAK